MSYHELIELSTFEDRFNYLCLHGFVGKETFGDLRWVNQMFYQSYEWKQVRCSVILRDNACNLAMPGYDIPKTDLLLVHHINPIEVDDILHHDPKVFDLDNLVCVSKSVHDRIHYGSSPIASDFCIVERRPNDTCPWKE